MKRARVICSSSTERVLIAWAHSKEPTGPRPTLDEAATLALDEFAREQKALVERLSEVVQIRRWG
jgi:hypothetical protein